MFIILYNNKWKTRFTGPLTFFVALIRYILLWDDLKTSSLFCRPGLTPNIIHLSFFGPARWKTHFLFASLARWKSHLLFDGLGPCRLNTYIPVVKSFTLKVVKNRIKFFLSIKKIIVQWNNQHLLKVNNTVHHQYLCYKKKECIQT